MKTAGYQIPLPKQITYIFIFLEWVKKCFPLKKRKRLKKGKYLHKAVFPNSYFFTESNYGTRLLGEPCSDKRPCNGGMCAMQSKINVVSIYISSGPGCYEFLLPNQWNLEWWYWRHPHIPVFEIRLLPDRDFMTRTGLVRKTCDHQIKGLDRRE